MKHRFSGVSNWVVSSVLHGSRCGLSSHWQRGAGMTLLHRAPAEMEIRHQLKDMGKKRVSLEDMALNSVVEASESSSVAC